MVMPASLVTLLTTQVLGPSPLGWSMAARASGASREFSRAQPDGV